MRRRDVIAFFGSAVAAWPFEARAQLQPTPVIGFLNGASPGAWTAYLTAFRAGLNELGYVEGGNVSIEYRWADGRYDILPKLAAELVNRHVTVIVATGGTDAVRAAKAATTAIPIVFGLGSDPVQLGLVASLNRPGGNITGVHYFLTQMETKRIGLLHELVPKAKLIAVLMNRGSPAAERQLKDIEEATRTLGRQMYVLQAGNKKELEAAFAAATQRRAEAMLVGADPFLNSQRDMIISMAAQHAIPAIYEQREHAIAGGLISYGTSLRDGYRQVGLYTGRVLKGEKPADLPVVQSVKFELVINLKTAKTLGLSVSPTLLARADEVIE